MIRFLRSNSVRRIAAALCVAGAALLAASPAQADKLHLKDGRVLDGKVVREGKGFIYFKVKVGTLESEQLFVQSDITKIERDDPAPKTDENIKKDEDAKADAKNGDAKADAPKHTGATRVAILNFGPPAEWQGAVGNMVGLEVNAAAFKRALPLLEKAKAEIVVIRINSGGGASAEMPKFHELFEGEYKNKFRTVCWVESAISCAAMSPWVLEEFYFMSKGNMGACTEFSGRLNASTGMRLEMVLASMEKASIKGKKDPRIMRAMEIQEPLSVDVDENGEVHWRQDELGQFLLNRKEEVFTINAQDAVKFKFAKGIADTREQLAKAMGLQEVEWVAQDATDLIDKNMRDVDSSYKRFNAVIQKYEAAAALADQIDDKQRRGIMLADAKRYLAEIKQMLGLNPNFAGFIGLPDGWVPTQEERLKKIGQKP